MLTIDPTVYTVLTRARTSSSPVDYFTQLHAYGTDEDLIKSRYLWTQVVWFRVHAHTTLPSTPFVQVGAEIDGVLGENTAGTMSSEQESWPACGRKGKYCKRASNS